MSYRLTFGTFEKIKNSHETLFRGVLRLSWENRHFYPPKTAQKRNIFYPIFSRDDFHPVLNLSWENRVYPYNLYILTI